MSLSVEAVAVAKKYTDNSIKGISGTLAGKNCTIKSIQKVDGVSTITFEWIADDGTVKTSTMNVVDGKDGIDGINGINGKDGKDGKDGIDGYSPTVVENANNTEDNYKLDITTKTTSYTTPNLKGKQGVQGLQGIRGEKGEQGETGLQGQQGIQGVKGDKGDDGYPFLIYKQYEVGIEEFNEADYPEIGLMFMIHVFEEGKGYPVYRYTADGTDTPYSLVTYMNTEGIKGEKGDRGEQGEQGIAGLDGKDGKDGTTYTPSIGEVTTVDSNELASASVSVNTETKEAVFNFAIPKGKDGDRNADTVNNHTVKSDVPENAVFTDTVYDDTELNAKLGELSQLKTTEKTNLVGAINEVAESCGNVYSTEEKVIGTWIDGKPIYRKVYKVTNITTNIDLSELNIADIITINISSKQINNDITAFPYAPNNQNNYNNYIRTGYYKATTKEWIWQFGSTVTTNFTSGIFIIEYTKTTD